MSFFNEYTAIFLIGFLSSMGHCVGMCGGFVVGYSMRLKRQRNKWAPHLLYNSGRILTYSILGLFFGFAGQTVQMAGGLQQYQNILQLVAGIAMILIGLDMGGWLPGLRGFTLPGYGFFHKLISGRLRNLRGGNVFPLGMAMGLIPCGLVYAAGAQAAAAGGAINGAMIMAAFGLGTLPALLMIGLSANAISVTMRSRLFRVATVLVVIFGLVTVYRGGSGIIRAQENATIEEINCLPVSATDAPSSLINKIPERP